MGILSKFRSTPQNQAVPLGPDVVATPENATVELVKPNPLDFGVILIFYAAYFSFMVLLAIGKRPGLPNRKPSPGPNPSFQRIYQQPESSHMAMMPVSSI